MVDTVMARRAHENLRDVYALSFGAAPEGVAEEGPGGLVFAVPLDFPFFNGVMPAAGGGDGQALARRGLERFGSERRGFVAFVRSTGEDQELEAAAREAGMFDLMPYPQMVCEARLEEPELEAGIEIVAVSDESQAGEYWAVCEAAYPSLGFPPGAFGVFPPELLLDERVHACLARRDGETLAAASVWMAGGVGMIGWVASAEAARRRGLAGACTVWATNRGLEAGADFTALNPSHMGESLYRRLGYEEIYTYRLLGWMPPSQ